MVFFLREGQPCLHSAPCPQTYGLRLPNGDRNQVMDDAESQFWDYLGAFQKHVEKEVGKSKKKKKLNLEITQLHYMLVFPDADAMAPYNSEAVEAAGTGTTKSDPRKTQFDVDELAVDMGARCVAASTEGLWAVGGRAAGWGAAEGLWSCAAVGLGEGTPKGPWDGGVACTCACAYACARVWLGASLRAPAWRTQTNDRAPARRSGTSCIVPPLARRNQ